MTTGQLSKRGAGAMAAHEACYLYAYPDPATGGEPWTIGIGHTSRAGLPTVKPGDRITLAQAFEIYRRDTDKFAARVRRYVKPQQKQHQFDALVSFDLNTGQIAGGTVDDKLNAGNVEGALATWGQYVNAAGKRMAGLVTRRAEEISLYRTGVYPSRQILLRETPTGAARRLNPANIPWDDAAPVPAAPAAPIAAVDFDRPLPPTPVQQPKPAAPKTESLLTTIWRWLTEEPKPAWT